MQRAFIKTRITDTLFYFWKKLSEFFKVTKPDYGDYTLEPINIVVSQERQLKELNKGTFDVFWTMTTPSREVDALAVNEPLIKGAYGIRLLVTHLDFLPQLSKISTLSELAAFEALSGSDWPDTAILRMNHLQVSTALFDKELYNALLKSSDYYFPRGLLEAYPELNRRNKPELVIAPNILLRYPAVMKFFVAKNNSALARRLEDGLKRLKQNGVFDQLFYQFAPHAEALKYLNLKNATVIELKTPFMVSDTERLAVLKEQNELLMTLGVKYLAN